MLRRTGRIAGILLAGLVLLAGAGLVALQTQTGATAAARFIVSQVNPLVDAQVEIDAASGNWVRSLRLTGVTVTRTDSASGTTVQMAHADTLTAQYELLPLLRGRVHVTDLSAVGPSVTMRQAADSTWDWSRALPSSTADDTSGTIPIQVGHFDLTNGAFSAAFYAEGRDSTARVHSVRLGADNVEITPTLSARIDTLGLRAGLPGDTTDITMIGSGQLEAAAVQIDTFQLDSPRTRVRGHGRVPLQLAPATERNAVSFRLSADPLVLQDLTPFLPTLDVHPDETVFADLNGRGSGHRLTASVNAQFSGGGRISGTAAAPLSAETRPDDSLRYHLDATVQGLTTSLAGPLDPQENQVNATAAVALSGQSLRTLDGTVRSTVSNTHWNGVHTPEIRFTSSFEDGRAHFNLRGTLNEADVQASGTARPLDEAPSLHVTAQTQNLNVSAFAPEANLKSDVGATATLDGEDLGAPEMALDGSLQLDPSRIGRQSVDGGTISLTLTPDSTAERRVRRARIDGTISLPEGRVQALGTARLDGQEQFTLERLRVEDLNVAALAGDTTESRITGTVRATGHGFTPATSRLNAEIEVDAAQYGPYQLTAFQTTARLDNGRFSADAEATLNGSEWDLSANGRPFDPSPIVEITNGQFRRLDIGPFLGDTTQSSQLSGSFRGRGENLTSSSPTLQARLTLDSSRVNQQRIEDATLTTQLQKGALSAEATLQTPEGRVQVAGLGRPFDEVPTYELTTGTVQGLDVGALAGSSGVRTSLSGNVSLEGRGTSWSSLTLDAAVAVTTSTINEAAVSEGSLTVGVSEGRVQIDGGASIAGGQVRLDGRVDSIATAPAYDLQFGATSLDLGAIAGDDSLSARIDTVQWAVDGHGTTLRDASARMAFSAMDVQFNRLRTRSLSVRGTLHDGRFRLDTLGVDSNVFTAQGEGAVAVTDTTTDSSLTLSAEITNAQRLRELFGAETVRVREGTVEAELYGTATDRQFRGQLNTAGVAYNDVHLAAADVSTRGALGDAYSLRRLEVNSTLESLSIPSLSMETAKLSAEYEDQNANVSSTIRLDETHAVELQAAANRSDGTTRVDLSRLDVRLGPDRWSLARTARIEIGDRYSVQDFLLRSADQRFSVDGSVGPEGDQRLSADADDVRLGGISSLFGFPALDGTLSGGVNLTGSASDPSLDGQVSVDLRSKEEAVGTMRLDVGYDNLAVVLDATLTHVDGSTLTASGSIPSDLRLKAPSAVNLGERPVRLDASTSQFPVSWVDPFLDPATMRNVRGILAADVGVRGVLNDPSLSGTASLQDGGALLPDLGTSYHGIQAALRFSDDRATLTDGIVRSKNDGRLEVKGDISFSQLTLGSFDLAVEASSFLAVDTRAYRRAVVDGSMHLQGTTQEPVLKGRAQVRSGDVFYTEATAAGESSAASVSLTEEDRFILEDRFGLRLTEDQTSSFDFYDALTMDLTVRIQRDTWLRSRSTPEMNIQFTGELTLDKAHNEDARAFGTISVVEGRSTVRQFGQEFEITEGTLTFDGDPARPRLNVTAIFEQQARGSQEAEVQITLSLQGRPDNLNPTLSSDPPMETSDMLSYLATGRPANKLLSGGGGTSGGGAIGTQALLGQASSFVENVAASELGLDVVRLDIRPSGTSYLTVGRYFTPRLFLSIGQPVTASNGDDQQTGAQVPNLTLEYQFTETLFFRALNSQDALRLNLSFEYAY